MNGFRLAAVAATALTMAVTGHAAATTPPAAAPPTVGAGATSSADAPTKIVSLSPSATETLFAIGAGPQVIAVDEYSNYPAETQQIRHDLSGYTPNVEAIAALAPDLVIHDGTTELGGQLAELKIPDLVAGAPASLDGVFTQIEQLGAATGHVGEAAELVARMTADITAIVGPVAGTGASVPAGGAITPPAPSPAGAGLTYFHELDNTLYTMTSTTFIGQIYALFGLVNIADGSGTDNPYPQLSAETVITANPQLIFLADGPMGESPATVAARPGWAAIEAVKNGNVMVLDADIASRWGPRVIDMVKAVAEAVAKVAAPVGG